MITSYTAIANAGNVHDSPPNLFLTVSSSVDKDSLATKNGRVYLKSISGRYIFSMSENGDDHWEIIK